MMSKCSHYVNATIKKINKPFFRETTKMEEVLYSQMFYCFHLLLIVEKIDNWEMF